MTREHAAPGWPPSKPGDPGWAGDTPWAGGDPVRWAPRDGIDELDPRFPIGFTLPPAAFDRLLAHPPVTAPWRSRLGFTIDTVARAAAQDAALAPARTYQAVDDGTAPLPVIKVPVPRTYPELEEDTLAHEFTELDREALTAVLGGPLELGAP